MSVVPLKAGAALNDRLRHRGAAEDIAFLAQAVQAPAEEENQIGFGFAGYWIVNECTVPSLL
jgi:hypothetical protein